MDRFLCEVRSLSKSFGPHAVVSNLDLEVGYSEILGLVGRSGCGKSTVLNMIGLLEQPDAGEIRLCGEVVSSIRSKTANRLLRRTIGYLFQNSALVDSESADYNLRIAQAYCKSGAARKQKARADALAAVGLGGFGERMVFSLSGGEQQRLAIARLMLKPSKLILADEPTGSLDPVNRDEVLRLLLGMREVGKSIVIVTHDPVVAAACDRVVDLGLAGSSPPAPRGVRAVPSGVGTGAIMKWPPSPC